VNGNWTLTSRPQTSNGTSGTAPLRQRVIVIHRSKVVCRLGLSRSGSKEGTACAPLQ
jgi:hypothetical protein